MTRTLPIVLSCMLLAACGSDLDFQQMARASCALTEECYAPGVAPGTNPYRSESLFQKTQKKAPKYIIPVKGGCPNRYNYERLTGQRNGRVLGERICEYG